MMTRRRRRKSWDLRNVSGVASLLYGFLTSLGALEASSDYFELNS